MGEILDLKTCIILGFVFLLILSFIIAWKRKMSIYQKQEEELRMYLMYAKPLEEFIRDIRGKQHEFDNHLNAILNMHVTIDTYDELVAYQKQYIHELATNPDNSYLGLLKISNKVLAGFLYSKLKSASDKINIELFVGKKEIFTNVPEKDIIEVIGTLIDNAVEACKDENNQIKIYLTSEHDKLVFVIKNIHDKIPISELAQFFERGFSKKQNALERGYGLYNAKRIVNEWNGEIFVQNEELDGKNYLSFRVEL